MRFEELNEQAQKFIDKYLRTMDPGLSARTAGYDAKNAVAIGVALLSDKDILEALDDRRSQLNILANTVKFEKEDLLRVYWDMFNEAKIKGKLPEARAILNEIARYNGIEPKEIKKDIAVLNFNLDGDKI